MQDSCGGTPEKCSIRKAHPAATNMQVPVGCRGVQRAGGKLRGAAAVRRCPVEQRHSGGLSAARLRAVRAHFEDRHPRSAPRSSRHPPPRRRPCRDAHALCSQAGAHTQPARSHAFGEHRQSACWRAVPACGLLKGRRVPCCMACAEGRVIHLSIRRIGHHCRRRRRRSTGGQSPLRHRHHRRTPELRTRPTKPMTPARPPSCQVGGHFPLLGPL